MPDAIPIVHGEHVLRLRSNDADELTAQIPDWDVQLTQLRPGAFSGELTFISLGPAMICCGKFDQPLLEHVAGPYGCLIVIRPGRGSAPLRYLGHEVEDDECFVGGTASEGEAVSTGIQFPTALSVRLDAWQTAGEWLHESKLLTTRGTTLRRTGLPWASAFLDAMTWVFEAVVRHPEMVARADVRASLGDVLLARVNVLGTADFPVREDRPARLHRRVAVERARDYIRRNLTEPIRLSNLCRYARTEARALEYGFRDVVGLSPMQYKALFGESPSMTFRRTQAELPLADRRRRARPPPCDLSIAARYIGA